MEDFDYYRQIPYRVEISQDQQTKQYIAFYPDLPDCSAVGATVEEAIRNAERAKAKWFIRKQCQQDMPSSDWRATDEHNAIDLCMQGRSPLRVAAYIRSNVPNNGLRSPLDLQKRLYETVITGHPGWKLAGIFIDKGSAMHLQNRPGLQQLLAECEDGAIDVIICKNLSRLYRSIPETLSLVERLAKHDPPIGVYFEAEDTFSLSAEGFEG